LHGIVMYCYANLSCNLHHMYNLAVTMVNDRVAYKIKTQLKQALSLKTNLDAAIIRCDMASMAYNHFSVRSDGKKCRTLKCRLVVIDCSVVAHRIKYHFREICLDFLINSC